MTAMRIDRFSGMEPRASKRLLPENSAQDARNCFLQDGELKGLNSPVLVKDLGGQGFTVRRVYRIPNSPSDTWLSFSSRDVDIAKGPLVNDQYERYYWTGDSGIGGAPAVNALDNIEAGTPGPYKIGVPAPVNELTVVPDASGVGLDETRSYVYTYVNIWGEESAPSDPIPAVTGKNDDSWDISNILITPTFTNYVPLDKIRIYRTVTGTFTQDFRLVVEDDAANFVGGLYSDIITSEVVALNETLASTNYNLPPDDLMNLTSLPNGIFMGTRGRDIHFSEPYRPHAWPVGYILSVDYDVVGCAPIGNSAVIATSSRPYSCAGIHPSSMVLTKSDTIAPCLSKRSIVSTDQAVFYASTDGLIAVTPGGLSIITNSIITRRQWQNDYSASTIFAAQLGLNYIAFTPIEPAQPANKGWAIGLQEPLQKVTTLDKFVDVVGLDTDAWTGVVYLIKRDVVYEWNPTTSIPLDYVWHSKDYVSPRPINLGAARFKLISEGEDIDTGIVEDIEAYNTARISFPLNTVNLMPVNSVYKWEGWKASEVAAMVGFETIPNNKTPLGGSPLLPTTGVFDTSTLFEVFADNRKVYSGNIFTERLIRLPSGFKAFVWSFRINSNTTIYSLEVAETGKQLMTV